MQSPDALITTDLPRAFPEWLKNRFPPLRAEESNALYLAFRRRRLIYRPSARARFRAWFDPRTMAIVLAFPTILLLGIMAPLVLGQAVGAVILALVSLAFWPLLIGAFLLIAYLKNARRREGQVAYLPPRVAEVFGAGGFLSQAALDVWMCGYTGREVAEAIFLENFERSWRLMTVVVIGLFMIPTVVALGIQFAMLDWFDWSVVLSVILAGSMCWWTFLPQLFDLQGTRHLERRYAFWRSRSAMEGAISEFGRVFGENIFRTMVTGAVVAVLGLLVAGVGTFIFGVLMAGKTGSLHDFIRSHQMAIGTHLFLWWIILVFVGIRLIWAKFSVMRLQKAIQDAEYPFALLMASVVCEDPEGEDWARWRFGLRPLVRPVPPRR